MKLPLILFFLITFGFFQATYAQAPKIGAVIDTTITGFHFALAYSGTMMYTQHGPADIISQSQPTSFSVTVSRKASFDQAQAQLMQLLKMSMGGGYKISEMKEKDTVVNGRHGYYVSYTETLDMLKYQNFVFNGVVEGDGVVIVFTSGDSDKGKFVDAFKKTFFQLKC